jgi:hypothetical protein
MHRPVVPRMPADPTVSDPTRKNNEDDKKRLTDGEREPKVAALDENGRQRPSAPIRKKVLNEEAVSFSTIARTGTSVKTFRLGSVLENWIVCLRSDVGPPRRLTAVAAMRRVAGAASTTSHFEVTSY